MTMDRVRIIERALHCYYAGWWSLFPVLGIIPAVMAFYLFFQVRAEANGEWNPAAGHLRWGFSLALLGAGISLFVLSVPLWPHLF